MLFNLTLLLNIICLIQLFKMCYKPIGNNTTSSVQSYYLGRVSEWKIRAINMTSISVEDHGDFSVRSLGVDADVIAVANVPTSAESGKFALKIRIVGYYTPLGGCPLPVRATSAPPKSLGTLATSN